MKKALSIALTLAFLLICVVAAADEAVTIGDIFSFMRPDALVPVELTEADLADGMVYYAASDELEVLVWAYETDGKTKEELYDMYREDEWLTDVTVSTIGGVETLTYSIEEEGLGATVVGDTMYYELVFYTQTQDAQTQAKAMLDSFTKI